MTKTEIQQAITRRVGDTAGTQFGDRAWEYFEQELYKLLASGEGFSGDEIGELRGKVETSYTADNKGRWTVPLSTLTDLYQIERVFVEGYPAKEIGEDEYYLMIDNPLLAPANNEYKYLRLQNEMLFLSSRAFQLTRSVIYYYKTIPTVTASRDINLGKHITYLAVERAVQQLKLELGMML
jgi:hypothetical protein